MPHDISWDEYNAAQAGRPPRASLGAALDAVAGRADRPVEEVPGSGRVAVDVGCGEGVEVTALLEQGWTVHALDGEAAALDRLVARTPTGARQRLHVRRVDYGELDALPDADLVHASYSLPYCGPAHFDRVWAAVRAALRPGAVLACQLFGPHDDAYGDPEMTFHTADEARELLNGLEVVSWTEEDADRSAYTGPRHWHVFHVVARRPHA